MPGTFSKNNRPRLPGAYFNFEAAPIADVPPSAGATVAIVGTHDWGPLERVIEVESFPEWQAVYGKSDTQLSRAVKQAFYGEGTSGRAGAGAVKSLRVGGSAAAKATVNIPNTAGTPVDALSLTAVYEGEFGEGITAQVMDNAADNSLDDLVVYVNGVEVERFTYSPADITGLAETITDESDWVDADDLVTGQALNTSLVALAAGNDGATLSGGDVTGALGALEVERFAAFALADLAGTPYSGGATASSVLTAIKTWVQEHNGLPGTYPGTGKRFFGVAGGAAAESAATANARSATLEDPNFLNLGVGTYEDTLVTGTNRSPRSLSTSELAPRLAGILASRGEGESLTFARMAGLTVIAGPTEADVLSAFDAGTMVLARDSDREAPVRIAKGLTTFTDTDDETRPYLIYRNPKFVRTMHGLEMELTEWAESNVIGRTVINDKTRDAVLAELGSRLRAREDVGILQPGSTVAIDQDPPPAPEDEFIALVYGIKFGRSTEQVFNTVTMA